MGQFILQFHNFETLQVNQASRRKQFKEQLCVQIEYIVFLKYGPGVKRIKIALIELEIQRYFIGRKECDRFSGMERRWRGIEEGGYRQLQVLKIQYRNLEMYSQQKKLLQLHAPDSRSEIKRNRERKEKSVGPSIFIAKTFEILENNFYSDVVSWNHEGTNFMINDIVRFEQEVLPLYFRHRKFSSFVRQLNMYDFHKIRNEANKNIFEHKEFRRNSHQSLRNIRRKGCGSNRRCEITDANEQIQDVFESSEDSNYEDHFGKSIENGRTIQSIERLHNSPSTLNISHQTVEDRERAINEFVESLPDGLESQNEVKSIIDEMKRNSKFNWVSSKQDIRKVIKKIKRSKMTKRIELEGLEDLSIEQEIMVENIDSRQVGSPELELFRSQIWPSFLENGSCMMLPVAAQICENWLFEV